MVAIFLDRENSGHISQINVILSFKKTSQKIKIVFLYISVIFCQAEHTLEILLGF